MAESLARTSAATAGDLPFLSFAASRDRNFSSALVPQVRAGSLYFFENFDGGAPVKRRVFRGIV